MHAGGSTLAGSKLRSRPVRPRAMVSGSPRLFRALRFVAPTSLWRMRDHSTGAVGGGSIPDILPLPACTGRETQRSFVGAWGVYPVHHGSQSLARDEGATRPGLENLVRHIHLGNMESCRAVGVPRRAVRDRHNR